MDNRVTLLLEFITKMDRLKITPYEKHIDIYLANESNKDKLRVKFIRFCFYHWGSRHDRKFIENVVKYEII